MTGHSLGAGVGTLVSYAAQSYLNQQQGAAAPVVGAVLVAPPNAGSPEFVDSFNQLVNARRLAFEYDIVPQVREMVRSLLCAQLHAVWRPLTMCSGDRVAFLVACRQLPCRLHCSSVPSSMFCVIPCLQAFCTPEMPSCPPGRLPGTVGAVLTAVRLARHLWLARVLSRCRHLHIATSSRSL